MIPSTGTIWEEFCLEGGKALVTGGTRGLGRAIALAQAGAHDLRAHHLELFIWPPEKTFD